jgi:hypothetical protein
LLVRIGPQNLLGPENTKHHSIYSISLGGKKSSFFKLFYPQDPFIGLFHVLYGPYQNWALGVKGCR